MSGLKKAQIFVSAITGASLMFSASAQSALANPVQNVNVPTRGMAHVDGTGPFQFSTALPAHCPPVQAQDFEQERQGGNRNRVGAIRGSTSNAPPALIVPPPPAPPPPPPPTPPSAAPAAGDNPIIVSGSREVRETHASLSPLQVTSTEESQAAGAFNPSQILQRSDSSSSAAAPRPNGSYVPPVIIPDDTTRERYDGEEVSPVKLVGNEPVSTSSVDVDTGAYSNARRFIRQGQTPPKAAVRTEEMINYFRYDYPAPSDRSQPFTVNTDLAKTPWNDDTYLMRIGLRGYDIASDDRPAANLVFLMDVSGSMNRRNKLPLVVAALKGLANEMREQDRISIVVYAGAAGLVLEPTNDVCAIHYALDRMRAGGSTAGGAGIELAYNIAQDTYIEDGINRVILATDGDFNVGTTNRDALIELIEKKRETGITLTTLGFGAGNYNEAMMEQIANHGNGNYSYIDSALEARKVLVEEMSSTLFTIAKDVKIQVEFNPAVVSQYRLIGYENRALREEDFDNDAVDAGDIGAGHQVTAIYEVVPNGTRGWIGPRRYEDQTAQAAINRQAELAHVKLRYKLPDGDTSRLIESVVRASEMRGASTPQGDFAFAASVAAFGQLLRGDELMMGFTHDDIGQLAGQQSVFWRQEFLELNAVVGSTQTPERGGG